MLIKVLVISLILVAFVVLALGIKLWIDPKSTFEVHSCALDSGDLNEDGTCLKCQIKDLANCPEKTNEREEK
jgi:hypothetical protein